MKLATHRRARHERLSIVLAVAIALSFAWEGYAQPTAQPLLSAADFHYVERGLVRRPHGLQTSRFQPRRHRVRARFQPVEREYDERGEFKGPGIV